MKEDRKQRTQVYVGISVVLAVSFLAGGWMGDAYGFRMQMIQAYKLASAGVSVLDRGSLQREPSLREYLKTRMYYYSDLASIRSVSPELDLGPVDRSTITGFPTVKDASDPEGDYLLFRGKLPKDTGAGG